MFFFFVPGYGKKDATQTGPCPWTRNPGTSVLEMVISIIYINSPCLFFTSHLFGLVEIIPLLICIPNPIADERCMLAGISQTFRFAKRHIVGVRGLNMQFCVDLQIGDLRISIMRGVGVLVKVSNFYECLLEWCMKTFYW